MYTKAQSFQVQHQTTFKNKEPVLLLTCEVCHILRYPAQCLELLGDDFSHLLVSVGLYFPEAIAGLPSKSYTLSLFYFDQHMYKDKKLLNNNKIAYMIYNWTISKDMWSYLHLRKNIWSHNHPRIRVRNEIGRAKSSQEVKLTPESHSWPSYSFPAWAKALKHKTPTIVETKQTLTIVAI